MQYTPFHLPFHTPTVHLRPANDVLQMSADPWAASSQHQQRGPIATPPHNNWQPKQQQQKKNAQKKYYNRKTFYSSVLFSKQDRRTLSPFAASQLSSIIASYLRQVNRIEPFPVFARWASIQKYQTKVIRIKFFLIFYFVGRMEHPRWPCACVQLTFIRTLFCFSCDLVQLEKTWEAANLTI